MIFQIAIDGSVLEICSENMFIFHRECTGREGQKLTPPRVWINVSDIVLRWNKLATAFEFDLWFKFSRY